MFAEFNFQQLVSAFIVLFAVIDIIGAIPIILNLKQKGRPVNAPKATLISFALLILFFFGGDALAAGGTERDDLRVRKFQALDPLEELHFGGVGKRVARLDEVYAEPVQRLNDFYFVVYRKGNVCALRTVAQRRIENSHFHFISPMDPV